MAKHFLDDCVEGEQAFRQEVWYNPHGDCFEFCASDEAVVADRIDEVITIYRSAEDNRPIGFQIKGVAALLGALDASYVRVEARGAGEVVKHVGVQIIVMAALRRSLGNPTVAQRLDRISELLQFLPDVHRQKELAIKVPSAS